MYDIAGAIGGRWRRIKIRLVMICMIMKSRVETRHACLYLEIEKGVIRHLRQASPITVIYLFSSKGAFIRSCSAVSHLQIGFGSVPANVSDVITGMLNPLFSSSHTRLFIWSYTWRTIKRLASSTPAVPFYSAILCIHQPQSHDSIIYHVEDGQNFLCILSAFE
jgi:hypothetical protein